MPATVFLQNPPPQAVEYQIPHRVQVAFLPLHLVVTGLVTVASLTTIALGLHESPTNHDAIAISSGLTIMALIAYARYFLRLPWMSASVMYLSLFWVFHCGMTFTAVLFPSVLTPLTDWEIEWFYWPNVRMSMVLSVIGAGGFVFGVGLLGRNCWTQSLERSEKAHDSVLYGVGWLLMLTGLGGTAVIFARAGGLGIFSYSYLDFRSEVLGPTYLQSTMDIAQLGCLLAICGAGAGRWVIPLALWTVLAGGPLLLLGMRGEAMIPLVSFAVVLTHRGVRWRRSLVIAALLLASIVIPAIQVIRIVGFGNRSLVNWTEVTPLDTLTELGASLRSTKAYVDWIEDGDPHLLGASYWAPVDRQLLTRVLPWREPIPYAKDERVPLRLMDEREGAVGGSATGEAYYNFGPFGPFLFLTCVGVLLGWLERRAAATPHRCAVLGVAMLLFIPNIRSDWLALPAQMAMAVALLGCCYALRRILDGRTTSA